MLKVTRWSPDTCGCVIDYEWDDAVPAEQRTHTHVSSEKVCAVHAAVPHPSLHGVLTRENSAKNVAHFAAMQAHPKLHTKHPDGTVVVADGVTFRFEFTGSGDKRTLAVGFDGVALTPAEKVQLQSAVAAANPPVPVSIL